MDLEGLILRYYLKVFSIFLFVIIFFIFYSHYILNKKNYFSVNIINISKNEDIESILYKNFVNLNYFDFVTFKYFYRINAYLNINNIHYGDFYVKNEISFLEFLDVISKPSNILNKLTIVEGWSEKDLNNELAKYFKDFDSIDYDEILADTYYFSKNEDFSKFIERLKSFKKKYLIKNNGNKFFQKYDYKDLLIIGSLVEKEGLGNLDKMKISSVINNRLEKNMKLQIDATVVYAITNGAFDLNRNLKFKDYKFKHPYNTYIITGLPPSPIAYVGTNTIDIILKNYKSDFLFYFYNNALNKHIFSRNFDEHKKKLNDFRQKK